MSGSAERDHMCESTGLLLLKINKSNVLFFF